MAGSHVTTSPYLHRGEAVRSGLIRLAMAIAEAPGRLRANRSEEPGSERHVHQIRLAIKRLRALLRLLEPVAVGDWAFEQNQALREVSAKLSGPRDQAALRECLRKMAKRKKGILFLPFLFLWDRQLGIDPQSAVNSAKAAIEAEDCLLAAARAIGANPINKVGWAALAPGLEISYRKMSSNLAQARQEPSQENIHRLRRRTKDHLYQLDCVRGLWVGMLRNHRGILERMGILLGRANDLAELEIRLIELAGQDSASVLLPEATRILSKKQEKLFNAAQKLARVVIQEEPSEWVVALQETRERRLRPRVVEPAADSPPAAAATPQEGLPAPQWPARRGPQNRPVRQPKATQKIGRA